MSFSNLSGEAFCCGFYGLFGTEDPIPCIPKARAYIGVLVKAAIQMPHIDMDVRVGLMKAL